MVYVYLALYIHPLYIHCIYTVYTYLLSQIRVFRIQRPHPALRRWRDRVNVNQLFTHLSYEVQLYITVYER